MNSVFDALFLRRPKIEYVSPPVCDFVFSSSGAPVIVLNDITKRPAPTGLILGGVGNFRLSWDAYPGALCYSVYRVTGGMYVLVAECITDTFFDLTTPGDYSVTVITLDGESEFSQTITFTGGGVTCGCPDTYTVCPDDFPGLVGWYSADCIVGADDGDPVTEWEDKAVGPGNMGDTTSLLGPIFKENIFGGKPALYFTGTRSLTIPSCPLFGDFTILAITKLNTPGQVTILGNTDTGDYFLRTTEHSLDSGFLQEIFQGSSSRGTHMDVSDATGMLNGIRRSDVFLSQTAQHSYNDIFSSAAPVLFDASNFQFTRIGVGGFAYAANDGYIAEICVWNTKLTNLDIQALFDNYFKIKYNL